MAQVIPLREARRARAQREPYPSKAGHMGVTADIHRAIGLLEFGAERAHLLVRKVPDPFQRKNFEAQLATIEKLIQVARGLAMSL